MQAVVSVEKISERYLLPALQQLLDVFPFIVLGFHADIGLPPKSISFDRQEHTRVHPVVGYATRSAEFLAVPTAV